MPCIELPCNVVNFITAHCAMPPHTLVGQLSYVPRPYAGRVDDKLVCQSCFVNYLLHDGISRRRTANVAKADKKNSCLVHNLSKL